MNKWMKKLAAALCAAVLMCGMAVTAYAGGGEEWDGLDPVEPPPMETVDPGEGFTEDGNLVTRDLLYDKATNKQFITVQTSGGNTFYIVIDYDKPTDEDGEQYQTYFLNMVDEADLLAAMQAAGGYLFSQEHILHDSFLPCIEDDGQKASLKYPRTLSFSSFESCTQ